VAKKAEAAQPTIRKAKKSYTNADLSGDPRGEPAAAPAPAAGFISATTGAVLTAEEMVARSEEKVDPTNGHALPEEHWRARADSLRVQIEKLQTRQTALRKPNAARDENAPARARNDAELAKVETGINTLIKQWGKLEEAARLAKVPSGWIEPRPQF
jgi:hypothetical protein